MGKFLALIVASAMALFIAGPAMAQGWDVSKTYTFEKDNTVTGNTNINVDKDIDIDIDGDLEATGGLEVEGDVVFKEMDVQVQDEEVVNKFFELDDSASSSWVIEGANGMNALEQLQNGVGNDAVISQLAVPRRDDGNPGSPNIMNVGLQYQVGNVNTAFTLQSPSGIPREQASVDTNNFAKQIQIGELNGATIVQNFRP